MTGHDAPPDAIERAALAACGLQGARLTPLRRGDNVVSLVETPDGERLVLRVHAAGRHGERALASELAWLDHLARVAHLPVPRPRRAASGAWAVRVDADDGTAVWCSVLTFLDGEALDEDGGFTLDEARLAGALVARLHAEAERAARPEAFERPRYDRAYFLACGASLSRSLADHVPEARRAALGRALERVVGRWPPLDRLPGGFGLVHADPHPGNFVRREDGLGLLDFDRCGWGPFLLDVAHATLDLEAPERAAFLTGYRSARPLRPEDEAPLGMLRVLAAVENLSVLARRPHELPFVIGALAAVERVLADLEG